MSSDTQSKTLAHEMNHEALLQVSGFCCICTVSLKINKIIIIIMFFPLPTRTCSYSSRFCRFQPSADKNNTAGWDWSCRFLGDSWLTPQGRWCKATTCFHTQQKNSARGFLDLSRTYSHAKRMQFIPLNNMKALLFLNIIHMRNGVKVSFDKQTYRKQLFCTVPKLELL